MIVLKLNDLEIHEIGFRADELDTYILKIFEEKNLFKSGEFIQKIKYR